jgi:hypothetical protein
MLQLREEYPESLLSTLSVMPYSPTPIHSEVLNGCTWLAHTPKRTRALMAISFCATDNVMLTLHYLIECADVVFYASVKVHSCLHPLSLPCTLVSA